jgi:addiction module RelB/DinJ family antitoxin
MYIRIDPKIKSEVEMIYARYGMSVTDAINIFLYQSRNINGLPFDLRPTERELRGHTVKSMKGCLKEYADVSLIGQEKSAWERAAAEKHDSL